MDATLVMDEFSKRRQKAQRNLLYLAIGSMIMVFAGLTSAYVVRRGAGDWFQIGLPTSFYVSSAVILFSSVTMNISLWSFRKDKIGNGVIFLGITFLLGLLFAFFQFRGYNELTQHGVYLVPGKSRTSLISGSFIYLLSGLHLAHMAGGVIALLVTFIRSLMGRYASTNVHGVRLCAIYWHFLDALWIYLFLFLTIYK